jgi:predicted nucleic acid binding AN1-type Zn finger protein
MESKKKTRCTYDGCSNAFVKIIGLCKFCSIKACLLHRLPEQHNCQGMHVVRKKAFDLNKTSIYKNSVLSDSKKNV